MNLANKLTLFRIVLIPVMIALFYLLGEWGGIAAAITFTVASITDILDGLAARKLNQVSDFGKIFDPLADKMIVTAALIMLVEVAGLLPVWGAIGVIVILLREFVIGIVRQLAAARGTIIAAAKLGKLKTLFLSFAIMVLLVTVPTSIIYTNEFYKEIYWAGHILLGIAVLLSIISLISYILKNKTVIKNSAKIKEVKLLNAGSSSAYPAPDTVFAVQEQYPQKAETAQPQAVQRPSQFQYQPQPQPTRQQGQGTYTAPQPSSVRQTYQPQTTAAHPHTINLIENISKDKLTKEIFDNIVLFVIDTQAVSLTKIQEKFQIGYRITSDAIDKMEEKNYITKLTPTSKRRILITREQYLEIMKHQKDI